MPPPELVPYELPSGTEVVGSHDQYLDDVGKELVYRFISPVDDLSKIKDDDRVICKTPGGVAVLETYKECKQDNGKVKGVLRTEVGNPNTP
jgi:hypothetical protein